MPENSIAKKESQASVNSVAPEKKSRDLSNRPDTYNTQCVQGASKEYKSDLLIWDNIFAFLKDGNLPIDNNLAGVSRGHYNMMLLAGIMEILSATIKEMMVGPSQSVYRNRLQTITSCFFE